MFRSFAKPRIVLTRTNSPSKSHQTTVECGYPARVTVVSPDVTPALEALVEPGRLSWVRLRYTPGDLVGAWYVVAATDDPAVNTAVAEEAERDRIFCARADDRSASSAWTPAVGRHGELVVGVHGGGDPQRAVGVRDAVVSGLTDGSIADRAIGVLSVS